VVGFVGRIQPGKQVPRGESLPRKTRRCRQNFAHLNRSKREEGGAASEIVSFEQKT
jgi:hypothetical protein